MCLHAHQYTRAYADRSYTMHSRRGACIPVHKQANTATSKQKMTWACLRVGAMLVNVLIIIGGWFNCQIISCIVATTDHCPLSSTITISYNRPYSYTLWSKQLLLSNYWGSICQVIKLYDIIAYSSSCFNIIVSHCLANKACASNSEMLIEAWVTFIAFNYTM